MMVKSKRLLSLLESQGFTAGCSSRAVKKVAFVRPSVQQPLIEWIYIHCGGRKGEAAPVDVGVGITRRIASKSTLELKVLKEVASDKERCWTILKDDNDARTWEQLVANIAPEHARRFANERGPAILERTAASRSAAQQHLALIKGHETIEEALSWLKRRVPDAEAAQAERLAEWPGVMKEYGSEDVYRLACMLIVYNSEPIGDSGVLGNWDPLYNWELMCRIQLVADELLTWPRVWPADNSDSFFDK